MSAEKAAAEAGLSGSDTAEIEKFIDVMISESRNLLSKKARLPWVRLWCGDG
jgi:hypothetical protein